MREKSRSAYRLASAAAVALLLLTATRPVLADGFIIPDPPPVGDPPPLREAWLTIQYHRVTVRIEDQVAVTRVVQEFVNEHDWQFEGSYIFPLPSGASVSEFVMWVDGSPLAGEILEADRARRIYEDIVRRRRDPALLEYVGRDAVRARIFPIPPGGSRKIELEYTQVLPLENGLVSYVYPLDTEKFSARPLEDCSIHVEIRAQDPMRAIYSPTHHNRVFIERHGDHGATVGYEEKDVLPQQNFELVYTVSQEDVGLNLLTHSASQDAGFFLLMVAPSVEVDDEHIIPRDVLLVLDTSGSMEGHKLAQAKDALTFVLDHLNEEDRFNIVAFSTGISQYAPRLQPASEASQAVPWVRDLAAIGGTNVHRALLEALAQTEDGRSTVLVFLTDGLPTEGVTEIDQILADVSSAAPQSIRLFAFGVGDDVNTVLLETLAQQNRGATGYVRPDERIDEEVSAFYARIKTPILTDLELNVDDVVLEDVYPLPLPDLFAGSQLIVAGRFRSLRHADLSRITLSGQVDGQRRRFVYRGAFRHASSDDAGQPFTCSSIPRIWATRKIGHLLTQIRLHGEKREWVDAVVNLSIRYGIVTPYTSFLVDDEDILTEGGRERAAHEYMATPMPAPSGAPAVELAEEEARMREADSAAPPQQVVPGSDQGESGHAVRHVGSKAFVLQGGTWIDTLFNPDTMRAEPVALGSPAYFDLLTARPKWGAYLALGEHVIFVVETGTDQTAYEIIEGDSPSVQTLPAPTVILPAPADQPSGPTGTTGGSADHAEPLPLSPRRGLCPGTVALAAWVLGALLTRRSHCPQALRHRRMRRGRAGARRKPVPKEEQASSYG
jgi:Ca-activated chloride channel family protein